MEKNGENIQKQVKSAKTGKNRQKLAKTAINCHKQAERCKNGQKQAKIRRNLCAKTGKIEQKPVAKRAKTGKNRRQ